ncbi:MAG: hypothetical protein JOZ24_05395 [Candidatus Eremiobacteraeota bacterium]|nr:hypothetical protein [Candidatus Eremiobacteraeota bacterium]
MRIAIAVLAAVACTGSLVLAQPAPGPTASPSPGGSASPASSPAPDASPGPSSSPAPSYAPSASSAGWPAGTKLVTTCHDLRLLLNPGASYLHDSSGKLIVISRGTQVEARDGRPSTDRFTYVAAPTSDVTTEGYLYKDCLKPAS